MVARAAGVDAIHPGLRVPGREPRAGRRLRARGDHLDRAAQAGHGAPGQQGRGPRGGRARRGPRHARHRRPAARPGRGAAPRRGGGLPAHGQGELGRRGARHADGARPRRARGGGRGRAPRGAGGLRQRRGLPGAPGGARLAHRGADPGRPARRRGSPVRARLHRAAAAPEGHRDRPLAAPRPGHPRRDLRRGRAPGARGALPVRGHGRVPARRRRRRLLLHRGQPADPGRAHGHRGRHRDRHRQGADPARGGRGDRQRRERRAGAGGGAAERLGHAVPDHHRGPREPLHPRLRADQRLPRGDRLRHPPGRRHGVLVGRHHAVLRLAAGEGHRLGADPRRGHQPHGPRAARVPHPGREDEPAVPRGPGLAPGLPGGPVHHPLRRRDAGAVRVPPAPRPGDAPAPVHRRRAGQREPRGRRPAGAHARPPARRSRRSRRAPRSRRARATAWPSSAPRASRAGCATSSACC